MDCCDLSTSCDICKDMHWVWLGQDIQMYFRGGRGPCYNCGESSKNANPLVLWKGPANFVELAINGDGGCGHNANVP